MKMQIYTLDKPDIMPLARHIPKEVLNNIQKDGFYTLGAVCYPDGKACLSGMIQFYVDQAADGDCYGELTYVYVDEGYRRQSVGIRLTGKADTLLASEDVRIFTAKIHEKSGHISSDDLPAYEISAYRKACGCIATRGDVARGMDEETRDTGELRFFRFTGR